MNANLKWVVNREMDYGFRCGIGLSRGRKRFRRRNAVIVTTARRDGFKVQEVFRKARAMLLAWHQEHLYRKPVQQIKPPFEVFKTRRKMARYANESRIWSEQHEREKTAPQGA